MKILALVGVIILSFSLLMSTVSMSVSYADIVPPKHQSKIGITNDDIVCDSGLFKIFRSGTNSVACVKPSSVSKLVNAGWAKKVDEKTLNDIINRKSIQLAKINTLETIPIKTNVGKLASGAPIASYDLVFEICASAPIYAPDVLIKSDSETKAYELVEMVQADSCVLSATKIKASNPDSINITLQNKGDISEKIATLQNELDTLKEELQLTRQSLKMFDKPETQKQGQKVADIRKQINDKREELHRILFAIHTPQTSKQKIEKMTFSGSVIEGESAKILSVKDSTQTAGTYDAIFEACAGPTTIKLPVITVTSDKQNLKVKLGDKISANSCQMTSVKIEADDKDSITVMPAGNGDSSIKAADLELQIISLQQELNQEKQDLKTLIHNPTRPVDFVDQLDQHVFKITELRKMLTDAKAELNKILYLTYN